MSSLPKNLEVTFLAEKKVSGTQTFPGFGSQLVSNPSLPGDPKIQNFQNLRNCQKKVARTRKFDGSAQNFAAIIWCFHPQS